MSQHQEYQRRPASHHYDGTTEEQGVIFRAELAAWGHDVTVPTPHDEDVTPERGDS